MQKIYRLANIFSYFFRFNKLSKLKRLRKRGEMSLVRKNDNKSKEGKLRNGNDVSANKEYVATSMYLGEL